MRPWTAILLDLLTLVRELAHSDNKWQARAQALLKELNP
jgi:hypothetical protein